MRDGDRVAISHEDKYSRRNTKELGEGESPSSFSGRDRCKWVTLGAHTLSLLSLSLTAAQSSPRRKRSNAPSSHYWVVARRRPTIAIHRLDSADSDSGGIFKGFGWW